MDALEKSNTKLTEEVRNVHAALFTVKMSFLTIVLLFFSLKLAVANNRIITLQEDVERVKEESSYQLESRKASPSSVSTLSPEAFLCYLIILFLQAIRSDSASDGQALGETRKQLKEETLLRLVRFRPCSAHMHIQNPEFIYRCCFFLRA